ncbi:MAG: glycosyltransferase, partial [Anaerolineae bacterium]|nr:glycosyltransferase [Anaerolineae bacterium]
MRVCYVTTQAVSRDGWSRYTVEVALGARRAGIEPVLVTANPQVDPGLADCEHHVLLPNLFQGRATTLRTLLLAPQLRHILDRGDVVHCPVELYAPLVAAAAPHRMPFVLSVFGSWAIRPLETPLSRLVFAPAFRRADLLLSISGYTRDWLARLIN